MADYDYLDKGNDDGTVFGKASTSKVAFWGTVPADQAAALTTALTTITLSASATVPDYAIANATATSGFGFSSEVEAQSFLAVVQNLQTRMTELQTALEEHGLVAGGTDASTTSEEYDYVGCGNQNDGMIFGKASTSEISVLGALPVDQPAAITTALTTITCSAPATTSAQISIFTSSSGGYGISGYEEFLSMLMAVANAQARIAELESRLAELGVIAGGTALTSGVAYDYLDKGCDSGTIIGKAGAYIGFWGTTPTTQPSSLTAAVTTITITASTADYAISVPSSSGSYKAGTLNEMMTLLKAIANIQIRLGETETALEAIGLIAAN